MVRAHGHLPAQDLLVIFATNCSDREASTDSGDDLQRLFNCIVVRFIDGIDQLITLDVISRAIELDLVF